MAPLGASLRASAAARWTRRGRAFLLALSAPAAPVAPRRARAAAPHPYIADSMKKKISSPRVPVPPTQTWSNCLVVGNQVFVASMVARDGSGVIGGESMYGQATAIFGKIKPLMEAAGGTMGDI